MTDINNTISQVRATPNTSTVPPTNKNRLFAKPVLLMVGPLVVFVGSLILSIALAFLAQAFPSDPSKFKQASDQNILFSLVSILTNIFLYLETIALVMIVPCLIAGIVLALKRKQ